MNTFTTYSKAVAASALVGAAMALGPAAAAAAPAPPTPHRQQIEYAMPGPPRAHPLPPVSRGTTVVLPSRRELERFETELAGG